ncbi:MAG TPA: hypothetical protein PKY60_16565, partial [Thermoflexales bacterium]|nr:hypothetical protein [Thermoflexales bacterium]
MKKIISTLLALSVCATAITACSTAPASTATPTTKPVAATQSPTSAPSVGATGGPSGAPAMGMGGGVDKSSDTALQTMISSVKDKFKQFTYTDATTGKTLPYNLFIPANYDASKSYPLVLFIADSSVVGKEVTAPLTQGYG